MVSVLSGGCIDKEEIAQISHGCCRMSLKPKKQSVLSGPSICFNQKLQGHFDIDHSKYERFNDNISVVLRYDVERKLKKGGS